MQSTFVLSKGMVGSVACGADESDDSSDVDIINISLHNLKVKYRR